MSIEAYTAYRRASRRRSSRTPFNPLKSIENEIELTDDFDKGSNEDLEDVGIKIRTEPFADFYTIESELGRGKFATVKKCRCNTTGQLYAAKIQRKRRKAKDARNELIHEIKMLAMCKIHPRIIGLKEVFETRHEMIIVTDFACGGELYKYIEDTDYGFSEDTVKQLLQQTLEGLTFLHARNIVHMDIKPQNILMQDDNVDSGVVLCDLGFSRTVNSGEDVREIVGTPDFVAPEVLSYEPINTSCDMWSVGVLTYMMLTGCSPFAGNDKMETFSNITQAKVEFPEDTFVSEAAKDFVCKLLLRNPSKRMSAPECFEHPWLEEVESTHSESDDDVNEEKYKNDLSTIKECDFEKSVEENVSGDEDENDEESVKDTLVENEKESILLNNDIECCVTVTNEFGETETAETNDNKDITSSSRRSPFTVSGEGFDSFDSRNLTSIMEEEGLESSEEFSSDSNNNNEDKVIVVDTIKESPSQTKALKELTNQRKALLIPSPLSSPVGCRRTLIPSPETVQENEPFKKHQCRRDSNEGLIQSNVSKVEKSKILELECDQNTDTNATISKRGSCPGIRKTPIKSIRHTKSLVTFYENLLQHS